MLELDHVLNAAPEVLEKHRAGLAISRQRRLAQITDTTEKLLERISAVAQVANSKVLLHPRSSGDVVRATNAVSSVVVEFQSRLGIDSAYGVLESKKWTKAVAEVRDKVSDAGSDGLKNIKQFGDDTKNRALDKAEGVAASIAENIRKSRETDSHDAPDAIEK